MDTSCTLNISKDNDIKKILTVKTKPMLKNISLDNGNVKFDGVVDFDLLVVSQNDEILPLKNQSTFNETYEVGSTYQNCEFFVTSQVQDFKVTVSSSGDFLVNSNLSFSIYALNKENSVPIARSLDEVFTKEGEVQYMSHAGAQTFDFTHTITIDRDSKVSKIIYSIVTPCLKSVFAQDGSFMANIDLQVNCVYNTDDGSIRSFSKEYNVQREVSCEECTKDSILQSCIHLGDIQLTEGEENFIIDVPLKVKTHVYKQNTSKCILDAYSLKREVNLTTASFEEDIFLSTASSEESVLTTFETSDNLPVIDKLLCSLPTGVSIVNQQVKNSGVLLEGIASFNIIYLSEDDDGNKILNSLDVDIPYSNTFNLKDVQEGDMVVTNLVVKDASIKSKHGKELEILAELHATFNISRTSLQALTSSLTFGEDKPDTDYSLEIYLAKEGDTTWEIAKKLNIAMSDLLEQNPDLSLPIKEGDKIVAFHRKNN